eukprot:GHVS01075308.1.p1 GENE.GHVS01075308.1~~GHVS01075308.1.p1  ORF type:complete len:1279 (+),score=174.92 GHVS01075308.1:52-3888(+)
MGRQLRRVRSLLLLFLVLGSLIKRVTASKKQNVLVLIGQPSGHPPKESPPKESPPKESQPKESPASKSRYDLKDEETSPPAEVVEVSKRVGVEAPKELIAAHRKLFYDGRVVSKDMPVVVMFHKSLNIEELKKWLKSNFGKDVGKDVENKVLSKVEVRGESKLKDWEFDVKKPLKGWKIRKSEVFAAPESKELVVKSGSGELKKKEEPKIGKYIWFVSVEDNVEGKDSSKENAYWRTVILHQLELLARVLGNENEVTFNIVGSDFRIIPGKNGSFSGFGNGEKWSDVKNRFLKSEEDLGVDGAGFILKPVLLMLAHTDESEAAKMREYAKNIAAVPSILCNDPVKVDEESPFAVYRGSKLLIIDFEGTLAVPMRKVIDGGGDVKETLKLYKPGMREVQKAVRDVVFNKAMVSDGMPVIVVADSVESSLEIEYVKMVFGVDEYSCFTDLSDALKSVDPFWRGLSGIKIRRGTKLRGMGQVSHTADGTIPKAVGGSMKGFTEIPKDVFVVSCMHWLQNNFERRLGKSLVIMAVTEVVSQVGVLPADVHYVGDSFWDLAGKSDSGEILFDLNAGFTIEAINQLFNRRNGTNVRVEDLYIRRHGEYLNLWPIFIWTPVSLHLPMTVQAIKVNSKAISKRLRGVLSALDDKYKKTGFLFDYYHTPNSKLLVVVDTPRCEKTTQREVKQDVVHGRTTSTGGSSEIESAEDDRQAAIRPDGTPSATENSDKCHGGWKRVKRDGTEDGGGSEDEESVPPQDPIYSLALLVEGSIAGRNWNSMPKRSGLSEDALEAFKEILKDDESTEEQDENKSVQEGQSEEHLNGYFLGGGVGKLESVWLISLQDNVRRPAGGGDGKDLTPAEKHKLMLSLLERQTEYIHKQAGVELAELTVAIVSTDKELFVWKNEDGDIFFGCGDVSEALEDVSDAGAKGTHSRFIETQAVTFESVLCTLPERVDASCEYIKYLSRMTALLYNDPVKVYPNSAFSVHEGSSFLVVNFERPIADGANRAEEHNKAEERLRDSAVKDAMFSLLLNRRLVSEGRPLIVFTEYEIGEDELRYFERSFGMEAKCAVEMEGLPKDLDPYNGSEKLLSVWRLRASVEDSRIFLEVIIVSLIQQKTAPIKQKRKETGVLSLFRWVKGRKTRREEEENNNAVRIGAALMRVVEVVARTAVLPTVIHFVGESESGLAGKSSEGEIMFDSKKGVGLGDLLKEFSDKNVEDLYIKRNAEHLTFKSLVLPKTKSGGLKELMKGRASQLKDVSEESFDVRKCDVKSGKFDICKMART